MPVDTRGFDRIRAGLPDAIERGIERGATMIADLASQFAPKDTGDLSRDIKVVPGNSPTSRRVVAGENLPDNRAVFQEFGTIYQEAQSYMAPARRQIDVQAEVAIEVRKLVQG